MDLRNFSEGTPSFKESKKTTSPAVGIIIFALLAALGLFMGISGFYKSEMSLDEAFSNGPESGKCVSGVPAYGSDHANFEYDHKLSFLPLIDEYYYLVLPADQDKMLLVRADKDFGKNFSGEDYSNITGIEIKGNVKSTSKRVRENFSGIDYKALRNGYYIDMLSTEMNIRWLIIGGYNVILLICVCINLIRNGVGGSPATAVGKIIAGVLAIGAFFCTYLIIGMLAQLV